MKLLFITPQCPWPPAQGTALRNFHLLKAAASEHTVDLLTFARPEDALDAPALRAVCRRVEAVPAPVRTTAARLRDLALGRADMDRRLWSPAFAARLDAMLRAEAYDAVQLEGYEVAAYLLGPEALRAEAHDFTRLRPRLVFDDHNAEYALQGSAAHVDRGRPARWPRALYSLVQSRRVRRREALYAAAADRCLAVSAEDAAALEALVPGLSAAVVPNGVDCDAMPEPCPASEPVVFFAGKLDYRPNVDACEWLVRDIVPLVRRRVPGVRVVLAGRDPSAAVRRHAGPGVEVTGPLEERDLARRRAEAWVYAVPMRMGSGVRFKALEAMAAGIPLVSTTLGAAGCGGEHGRHLLIADDAESFAGALVSLLESDTRRRELAASARRLAVATHDWRHITPRLLDVYRQLEAPPSTRVSLVTTVLDEAQTVGRLAASIATQTRPPDETVVVDGGSSDGTAGVARAMMPPRLQLVEAPGAGISAGRNRAIREALYETIAVTDAGVELDPGWLERLTAPLERDPQVGVTAGFFVSAPESIWETALGATTLPDVDEIDPRRFLPSSRSVAFRRAAWKRAGGYPEWLDYCEDLVFDLALIESGARLRFVPRATVRFRPRASPAAFFKQYYRYARGDGKAGLWRRRYAIRYGAYVAGAVLVSRFVLRGDVASLALALLGAAAYLKAPLVRLNRAPLPPGARVAAAALVPLVRLIGDVAKMAGYPAGVVWRVRHQRRSIEDGSPGGPITR